ncbi:MAG: hypothetical protein EZS28_006376 [Streblomastix strix]|uniref:Uncharacterized protein n=1 Tax=Streblomastix strix TaxID=222440 RepID=A0A5J4WV93_9EUKA|nr:MAG: hypothetical protein EZS28_006376 [Streblomastix strix]
MQHQQVAREAAQVHHKPRETFPINGNARKIAFSRDCIVRGQVAITGIKQIYILKKHSTQLLRTPIREPKVEKGG